MESIILLLVLLVLVLPVVSFVLALMAQRRSGRLLLELASLREYVKRLERRLDSGPVAPGQEEEQPAPVLSAPPAMPATDAPPAPTPLRTEESVSPTPSPAPSPPVPARPVLPSGPDWRDRLRELGLWPPVAGESGRTAEVLLMQWWLPRLGGIFALLAALFFSVYLGRYSSPAVRFIQLLTVSFSIAGVGWYLERRHRAFGAVLLVTGLVMVYFTTVAGYAFPAVRIFTHLGAGLIAQGLALALIFAVGLVRRSEGMLLMGAHFGLFLAVFMVWQGVREGALLAAGFLILGGYFVSYRYNYPRLPWVLVPGGWVVLASYAVLEQFLTVGWPLSPAVLAYLHVLTAAVFASHRFGFWKHVRQANVLLALGVTLGTGAAVLHFRILSPDWLAWLYGTLGVHYLAWAAAYARTRPSGTGFYWGGIYGSLLISLFFVETLTGDLRWLALALQVLVLAALLRREPSIWSEWTLFLTIGLSLYHFWPSLATTTDASPLVWILRLVYPLLLLAALAWVLPKMDTGPVPPWQRLRNLLYGLLAVLLVWLWYQLGTHPLLTHPLADQSLALLAFLAVLPIFLPGASLWLPALAAALTFAVASVVFWDRPVELWTPALLVLWTAGALSVMRQWSRRMAALPESYVYLLILPALTSVLLFQTGDSAWVGPLAYGLGFLILAVSLLPGPRHLAGFVSVPAWVVLWSGQAPGPSILPALLACALGVGLTFLPYLHARLYRNLGWTRHYGLWAWSGWLAAGGFALFAARPEAWLSWQSLLVGLALLCWWVGHRFRLGAALAGGVAFYLLGLSSHLVRQSGLPIPYDPGLYAVLASGLVLWAAPLAWRFLLPRTLPRFLPPKAGNLADAFAGVLSFAVGFLVLRDPLFPYPEYATPILAALAFLLVLAGLFGRYQGYRIVGLTLLLVPLTRLFIVDVKEALHRILAFAVAALVLSLAGYLYHRLDRYLEKR